MNKTHIAGKAFALFALSLALAGGFSVSSASAQVGYGGSGGGATSFGGGGGGSSCPSSLVAPATGFAASIANENSFVFARNVTLNLAGGTAQRMAISNSATFDGASIENYSASKAWTLTEGEGAKTVYVRFYDNCGVSTPAISTSVQFTATRPATPPPATGNTGGTVDTGTGVVLGERITLVDELIAKVRFGTRSANVLALQKELIRLGFMPRTFRATNYYGTVTRAGVNAYLRSLQAPAVSTPSADTATLDQLIGRTRFGTRSNDNRALQQLLINLKFLRLSVPTNYYGPLTRDAIRRYQAAR